MKTRIIHTKIWEDQFFSSLNPREKLLFMYYISNPRIGLTGIYEIADRIVVFETGLNLSEIQVMKEKFQKADKAIFLRDWVYVVNSSKLGGYKGEKINKALENEVLSIPDTIYQYFTESKYSIENVDTVSAKSDTTINHKSEIINHNKGVVKGKRASLEDISLEDLDQIASDYQVPRAFVDSKLEDLENYCARSGKSYRDYKAALRDFVKKDAIKIISEQKQLKPKIAVMGGENG